MPLPLCCPVNRDSLLIAVDSVLSSHGREIRHLVNQTTELYRIDRTSREVDTNHATFPLTATLDLRELTVSSFCADIQEVFGVRVSRRHVDRFVQMVR